MGDSDGELELLKLGCNIQTIGDHELKTSPLITRDAVNISEGFAQRGLLGAVLSVHADDLPIKTTDPRIYLNLNAPSSGLVCGVQGSGKSHTVSCILESSLIGNRQIGTLPAPLGTVVFHFDEENGRRPCEAAYLSELKDDAGLGVEEVVVLVSPSNLRTRRCVYSGLKFVRVEPLRIAEQDLNATRMLSMMGADSLETIPLYMHTILSILREMGSDNFNYRDFNKRLKDSQFNQSQGAMLQLRLDLLDSFLQGSGPDVKSFFKPGRLVIIDISDPFVESTTAAMLFDICLGLFIEWKSSTGKLIVLDEGHKYLTNSDANRFTRSICSIIRQQRHLAARVIVSTQEPTVVPASVLGLLSWIICHRFSSPGWVKHLKHHICAVEDEEGRKDGNSDWGRRVMMLRTGEGILYSPESLFVKEIGDIATLDTGYAIIKTRPRLTIDGGASLLATEARREPAIPGWTGLATPPPFEEASSPALSYGPLLLPSMIPPNPPIPRIIDLIAASSPNPFIRASATTMYRELASPPSSSLAPTLPAESVVQPPATCAIAPLESPVAVSATGTKPSFVPSVTLAKTNSATAGSPAASKVAQPVSSNLRATYKDLIRIMSLLRYSGITQPDVSTISINFAKCTTVVYTGKCKTYLKKACASGIITLSGKGIGLKASLVPAFLLPKSSLPEKGGLNIMSALSKGSPGANPSHSAATPEAVETIYIADSPAETKIRYLYKVLIEEMTYLHHVGDTRPRVSDVGGRLAGYKPRVYTGKLGKYLEDALTAGVVMMSGKGDKRTVQLSAHLLGPKSPSSPPPQTLQPSCSTGDSSVTITPVMVALLEVIAQKATKPEDFVKLIDIDTHLKGHVNGDYKKAGYGQLADLASAAAEAGLVDLGGTRSRRSIRMKRSDVVDS